MFNFYFIPIQIRRFIKWLNTIDSERKLKLERIEQIEKYNNLSNRFKDVFDSIKNFNKEEFITKPWLKFTKMIEKAFYPKIPFDFLNNSVILLTMFVTAGGVWLKNQLKYMENRYSNEELMILLKEDYIGKPLLLCKKYLSSHNLIHHIYSIQRYFDKTQNDKTKIENVCEWGGGYGSMCRLFYRLINYSLTYILIDIPIFSAIQWLYLSVIFGENKVNLLYYNNNKIVKEKINILPIGLLDDIEINADLFISTWALSESTDKAQDYVMWRNFFNANKVLIARQTSDANFNYADRINNIFNKRDVYIEEIEFLPRNYYIFK